MDAGEDGPGVDDVAHVPRTNRVQYLFAALAGFVADPGADAVFNQQSARLRRCFDIKAHLIEPADQGDSFFFIFIGDAYQYCAVVFQFHPCGGHGFINGPVQFGIIADCLTS